MSPLPTPRRLAGRTARALGLRRPDRRERRVVLHLGSQKTGTTAVQAWCRDHAADLARGGVAARTRQPDIREALGGWYETSRDGADDLLAAYLAAPWRDRQVRGVLYSCESNVGAAFRDDSRDLYPRLGPNLEAIERATAGSSRHVQFTVRSYGPFLESAYQQQLKHGHPSSFDALADRVAPTLSWRPVVTRLVEVFGAENVTVYDYDRAREADVPLVRQVLLDALHRLGAGDLDVVVDDGHRPNTRYTQRMADLSLATLPLLEGREEREALHRFSVATLGRRPAPDDAPARFLADDAAAGLADRYAADVAWLSRLVEVR
ncbi:hypothetical protein ATJ88_2789 [Isoptericola jiangsuensis]|uniref:Sulfotransferase family protein n=1 Tax=Isoptericola jiangsuensis TaxID=548579 RepID=A0A2A9EZV2_9MICO|nr:hypothetical protein [Isoptericola jiangsuensis]PFG44071.1 hypothetical protein ATJ88_2789 [Isoptericola jiangsuensis]